eukprot:TRINITY_DN1664_c0_g1_i1.p1 TRINITY_DN1664_c0_g1~~TRINITY_DN1664_c0_g1_i1.p1  ORF type:complete len:509 (-),score=168.41 TRINITY_DN1664_c0_g1_i1:978-2504(-)
MSGIEPKSIELDLGNLHLPVPSTPKNADRHMLSEGNSVISTIGSVDEAIPGEFMPEPKEIRVSGPCVIVTDEVAISITPAGLYHQQKKDTRRLEAASLVAHVPRMTMAQSLAANKKSNSAEILGAIWNTVNNAVGAGMLAIPGAYNNAGIVLGTIMMFGIWFINQYSMSVICEVSEKVNAFSLRELATKTLDKKQALFAEYSIMLFCFGPVIAYCIVVGDLLPELVGKTGLDGIWSNREFVMTVVCICIMVPLSLLPNMKSLAFSSLVAVVCVFYVCGVITYKFFDVAGSEKGLPDIKYVNFTGGIKAIPSLIFSFFIHNNIIKIFEELKTRTMARMNIIIRCGVGIVGFLYCIAGGFGFLAFGEEIEDNILDNFDNSNVFYAIAQLGIVFIVIVSFPMWVFALRNSYNSLFHKGEPFNWTRHIILTLIIDAISLACALGIPDIGVVFGIFGVAPIYVGFLLPLLAAMKVMKLPTWKIRFYWAFMIVAVVLGACSLVFNIKDIIDEVK